MYPKCRRAVSSVLTCNVIVHRVPLPLAPVGGSGKSLIILSAFTVPVVLFIFFEKKVA